jgi:hypothetical protein
MQIACEDAGMQTVLGAVGERQCLIQCLNPLKNDNRTEYFLRPQVALRADGT